jgi:6,7-dimethyl-8-ribityllumazine synthase
MVAKPHVMIIEARFYGDIADELVRGAAEALEAAGASYERFAVPGVFETPAAVRYAVKAMELFGEPRFDGFVVLGCVIRGETTHYDYVCGESARGLQDLACRYSLSIGYGVLTVENRDQAWARARVDEGNKGAFAAHAALEMIRLKEKLGLMRR